MGLKVPVGDIRAAVDCVLFLVFRMTSGQLPVSLVTVCSDCQPLISFHSVRSTGVFKEVLY